RGRRRLRLRMTQYRARAVDQEHAQVGVAPLADGTELPALARRALARRQAEVAGVSGLLPQDCFASQQWTRPAQTAAVSPASVEGARRLRAMKEVARGEPIALRAALPRPGELSACPRAGQSRCAVTSSCAKQPWVSPGPALAPFTPVAGGAVKWL